VLFGFILIKLGLAISTVILIVLSSAAIARIPSAGIRGERDLARHPLHFRLRARAQAAAADLARLRLRSAHGTPPASCTGLRRRADAVNLLYALIGSLVGTLIGVLPGIGPVATIAMLLPTTYALQPVSALIMLAGIYYGAQYGGSTTSILLNMPGETPRSSRASTATRWRARAGGRRARHRRARVVLRRLVARSSSRRCDAAVRARAEVRSGRVLSR
jgi:hypothetical protein